MLRATFTVIALLITLILVPGGFAAWNEPHVEGARAHPLLPYYPQARVAEYDQQDFDSAEFLISYTKGAEEPVQKQLVEGRITTYTYEHKPGTSPLEIVRQYESALKKAGFITVFAAKAGDAYPGLEANPGEAVGSFRLDTNGQPAVYVSVHATPGSPESSSSVTIAEVKAMEEKFAADANSLFDTLVNTGRVAVYGINFDTGKATITPDSDRVLGEVQTLLTQHADLKLKIEGHTDNVGTAAANKKLSEDRANAVKAWLVGKGAKGASLTTAGYGDTRPIDDNATEAGRARNRRVELVKQ